MRYAVASLDDPVTSGTWAWSYRADGQPASVSPPSGWESATSSSYDAAGHLTGLATTNATFVYTSNRAGNRLTEEAQVAGDPQNGTATFTYDPLGRLAGYTPPGSAQVPYGWDAIPNRTSAGGVTTTFEATPTPALTAARSRRRTRAL